jgi:hypothetical protein
MTRVFLAAGVAALAIAAPASAGPHGGGGKDRQAAVAKQGGGGGQRAQAPRRGGGGGHVARPQRQAFQAPRMQHAQRAERPQRAERVQRAERRPARAERVQRTRVAERHQARPQRVERAQARTAERKQQVQRQTRAAERQQVRANRQAQNRAVERQQIRNNRAVQGRMAERQQVRIDRQARQQQRVAQSQQFRFDRQARQQQQNADRRIVTALRSADANAFRASRLQLLAPRTRILAPTEVVRYVGAPLSTVTNYVPLMALPASVSYLYPATPNYYYRYGGGYLYEIDRDTSLIAALIPLLAGGYLPGTYLPQPYMSSYVPSYYGLNSFYPASYDYGYGYGNICNRYAYGVVYQVDCFTGMVENVIPTYAGGYGVGQLLPSAYSYYNVPMQYRSMYYPTADYSYWYAPGAIYQYDRSSSLITSVAALMSPGFTIGQPMPIGYSAYNVPYAYRATYYDTPNAWYRYNNGYIYQVDPSTLLVTAIVASLLT